MSNIVKPIGFEGVTWEGGWFEWELARKLETEKLGLTVSCKGAYKRSDLGLARH